LPTSTAFVTRASQRGRKLKFAHVREHQAHGGIERDGQHRGHDHGQVLGVGERLEQPAFLRFQRQHRQERDGDHEQREETGPSDFLDRVDHHAVIVFVPPRALPLFELLMCLLDHGRWPRPPARRWQWQCRPTT